MKFKCKYYKMCKCNILSTAIYKLCGMDIKQWKTAVSQKAIFNENDIEEAPFHHCSR